MPAALIAQLVLEGLKTFQMVYQDIPAEERRKNWAEWCAFWRSLKLPEMTEPTAK
jgi:hypothetical protein